MAIVVLLCVAGCDGRDAPFNAYQRPRDAFAAFLPLEIFDIYACATRKQSDGIAVIVSVPTEQCYKMRPPKRYKGIWLDQFEGSRFFENASDPDVVKAEVLRGLDDWGEDEWLGWSYKEKLKMLPETSNARLVSVEFVGRRTKYRGRYGHMGGSSSYIVVDRMIAAKPVYIARREYLEDELRQEAVNSNR